MDRLQNADSYLQEQKERLFERIEEAAKIDPYGWRLEESHLIYGQNEIKIAVYMRSTLQLRLPVDLDLNPSDRDELWEMLQPLMNHVRAQQIEEYLSQQE